MGGLDALMTDATARSDRAVSHHIDPIRILKQIPDPIQLVLGNEWMDDRNGQFAERLYWGDTHSTLNRGMYEVRGGGSGYHGSLIIGPDEFKVPR